MKDIVQVVLIFSLTSVVMPGLQVRKSNQTKAMMRESCFLSDYSLKAKCVQIHQNLRCKGGFNDQWINGIKYEITHLTVTEWPGECFNVGHLHLHFPELRSLEIVNCTLLRTFKGYFRSDSKIEKITMHGLSSLWEIPPETVNHMVNLREMDLRSNMLRHMKAQLLIGSPVLERVRLSGNKWDCSDGGLDWLAMEEPNGTTKSRITDYYDLVCYQKLYRGKPLHKVMDIIKIDTIRSIVQNSHYKRLADLYLDNNSIAAVKELEGSEWFSTFRVLSLRGNYLKQIPVYAFDKAFQANNNIMHVFLGQNPWRCDCHFIPRFQGLLLKYKRVIRDLTDIRCSKSSDKKTSLVQISTMPLGNVCSNETELAISPINIVNIVLFALIMFILGKFLYDWRNFKNTGKLPWLSSVLP
ncbi:uncharacterized protein LOC101744481 isoform X4 [Bombyx mori]|uniref:Protein singed wings 2 n=1 Tax=Bombyx mori TaxID=7091 RepID=A0A8R2QUQ2_BOMMO|nr:uncharacterized protein LOC101744481 isoform X2 [Bombyx mori]